MPIRRLVLALVFAASPALAREAPAPPGPPHAESDSAFVGQLLARMTLEEKLGQLNQWHGDWNGEGAWITPETANDVRAGRIGSFLGFHGAAATRRVQRIAVQESRLHIPVLFASDVIHGYRTIFPVPLGEAASFDPEVARRDARVAATEAAAAGLHWTYAPMVDIARDPRWGRIVEGAGEDPYLGEVMAAARVRGFQGDDLTADGTLMATAKHFVAYGGAEAGRDYNPVDISERTLHEVYLRPFRAAVDAGAQAVMPAFNEIAGVPMHASRPLLTGVLRDAWGFGGVVVSDYTGVWELMHHGVAADSAAAAVLGITAGVNIDMMSRIYLEQLPSAVRSGRLPESVVDDAVRRVLTVKRRLGLFDDPYRHADPARERSRMLTPEHRAAALDAALASMVLLRNEGGVLPLDRGLRTLAVIGPLANDSLAALGPWAGSGRKEDAITPLAGLRAAVGAHTRVLFAQGAAIDDADTSGFAEAVRVARQADAVVLFVGEHAHMSGEANCRASLDLPGVQEALARAVVATGTPTVAVLLNGRPLTIPWLAGHVPAILEAWYPGVESGRAIAKTLFGDANPAGRLPVTFPRAVGQVPIYYAHKSTGRPPNEQDHFTSRYLDVPWTPLFPFGWGLSYTTFEYHDLVLDRSSLAVGDSVTIRVRVANTGRRAGDEVVQLYVRDDVASITRPVKELKGFRRVHVAAGADTTLAFTLRSDDLALLDASMRRVVEPGTFTVWVGPNSAEGLEAKFEVVAR